MRTIEADLFPAISQPHVERHTREVMSMSDYVQDDRRRRMPADHATLESRLMFGACYLLFLARAVVTRMMPWRKPTFLQKSAPHESVFREASSSARVMVASSFMGL